MYKFVEINVEKNMLLCSTALVGSGELCEVHAPDTMTPSQALSNVLEKIDDPNVFRICVSYNGHEAIGKSVELGDKCILRVLRRNLSGTRRRHFSVDEKDIVNLERGDDFIERKVSRAKTGSVRKKETCGKKRTKKRLSI